MFGLEKRDARKGRQGVAPLKALMSAGAVMVFCKRRRDESGSLVLL